MVKVVNVAFCVFCRNLKYDIKMEELCFKGNTFLNWRESSARLGNNVVHDLGQRTRGLARPGEGTGVRGQPGGEMPPRLTESREFTDTLLK